MRLPLPDDIQKKLNEARDSARAAVERIKVIERATKKTGMRDTVSLKRLRLIARELSKGKLNSSFLFRLHAETAPHKIALIAPHVGRPGADRPGSDAASAEGPRPAPILSERTYSFYEMNERMDRSAANLASLGVGPGVGVLFALKNRPESIILSPAVSRIGGAAVSASWRSTAPELEYLAVHSGTKVILFDADIAPVIRELRASPKMPSSTLYFSVGGDVEGFPSVEELFLPASSPPPDKSEESSLVIYTSGTTGKPKGAVRKIDRHAFAAAMAFVGETPMHVRGVHLAACPLYHSTAIGFTSFSFMLGNTVVIMQEFRPELFLQFVERYRVTTTALVPTMFHRLLELGPDVIRRYDTSSLTTMFSGGAPLSGPLAADVLDVFGDKLYNFYGATETGTVTIAGPDDLRASPGTIGRAVPGVEIRLLDDDGNEVAPGEPGELYARSTMMIEGYHADPQATKSSMRDGFFSVGDLARVDRRGCYHIEGRKRDMIITGGVNIYPAEVEAALDAHPLVADSAVVGAPDREWGERVVAFVQPKIGATITADELKVYCRSRLSGPKVPREIFLLDALPKNPTGKTLKRDLRDRLRDPSAA